MPPATVELACRVIERLSHRDAWEVARADIDDAIAVGDVALLVGRLHYRGKGGGVEAEMAAGWMLNFRDGKVVYFRAFREPEQPLATLGTR